MNAVSEKSLPGVAEALPDAAKFNLDLLNRVSDQADAEVSPLRAGIERIGDVFGTPTYFALVLIGIALWVVVNLWLKANGWRHYDEPPFFWLQGIVSSNALLLTVAVLIRQNRMSELAAHRAHLDLQINLLTEQKVSKAIELLGVLLDNHPSRPTSVTSNLDDLAEPTDPGALLDAIRESDKREE